MKTLAEYKAEERKYAIYMDRVQAEIRTLRSRRVDPVRRMLKVERNKASALRCLAHQKVVALESEIEFEERLARIKAGIENGEGGLEEKVKKDLEGLRRVAIL